MVTHAYNHVHIHGHSHGHATVTVIQSEIANMNSVHLIYRIKTCQMLSLCAFLTNMG